MHKSINGGESWRALNVGPISTTIRALAVDPTTPTTLYAGTNDSVLKSMDGGESWEPVKAGLSAVEELAIDPMTPAILYAGTWGGGVLRRLRRRY